jgi:hypothetical protein
MVTHEQLLMSVACIGCTESQDRRRKHPRALGFAQASLRPEYSQYIVMFRFQKKNEPKCGNLSEPSSVLGISIRDIRA